MNKRQSKKAYKKALREMLTCRKKGYSMSVINHGFVDKNGRPCAPETEGARLVQFRRTQIKRYKEGVL